METEMKQPITNEQLISDNSQKQGGEEEIAKATESSSEKPKKDIKEEKIDKKKTKSKPTGPKKTEAVVNGKDLPISTKHSVAICDYIRGKDIDKAISMLEQVEQMKKAVPMKGEIPHRKGKIMSGRYPINASKEFIKLLKSLKSNAITHELELEKYVLFCVPNAASRPHRRFGRTKFKRTHVTLKLIQPIKKKKKLITSQNKSDKEEISKAPKININNKSFQH